MTTNLSQSSHFSAGLAAQQRGLHELAIEHYQTALSTGDQRHQVSLNLAVALANTHRFEAAELLYKRVLMRDQNNASAWTNYGNLLCKQQRFEEAKWAHGNALTLLPNDVLCLYNAANVPFHSNQPETALYYFNEVLQRQPQHQGARWNRALALLQLERWQPGFAGYESRLNQHKHVVKRLPGSYWQGQTLDNRCLLLTTEQGYGDVIQFARYCTALKQRYNVKIVMQVRPALKKLMQHCPDIDEVIINNELPAAFDYYFPLLSLARIVETKSELMPISQYLQAPPLEKLTTATRNQIEKIGQSKKIKIGLNWQGKLTPYDRGCPLGELAPLLIDDRFEFYSLQQDGKQALVETGLNGFIPDLGQHIQDFADTAALIQALDLVISIDSAPAHLAGALNKPCLLMLLKFSDWRWHLARDDSPWYSKMRLFRQKNQGEWASVIAQIGSKLGHFADNNFADNNFTVKNMDFNSFFAPSRNTQ